MNALYSYAKQLMLTGGLNWQTDPIVCILVGTTGYTFSKAHQTLSDIPVSSRLATSGTLTGRTSVNGVADAADLLITGVTANTVNALVLVTSSGSNLVAYMDVVTGLPANPNGGDVQITWSNGSSKIFAL